jgi:hypothetical protein
MTYTFEHIPDTPIWWIVKDGVRYRDFTSLESAKAWLEHVEKNGEHGEKARKPILTIKVPSGTIEIG